MLLRPFLPREPKRSKLAGAPSNKNLGYARGVTSLLFRVYFEMEEDGGNIMNVRGSTAPVPKFVQEARERTWRASHISRGLYLTTVKETWPNKEKIALFLSDRADTLSREWPAMSRQALFQALVAFAFKIERAPTPEDCADEFFELLKHFACPEPGWEAIKLIIRD